MSYDTIDGKLLRKMFEYGAKNLELNKKRVDELNVFPVPDGDTGTNMSLTVTSAIDELGQLNSDKLYSVAKTASSGALIGARGNSGVILSQLFRGLAAGLKEKNTVGIDEIVEALNEASKTAYKAVMKPTEGTILTVARMMSEFAAENKEKYKDQPIDVFFKDILEAGNEALASTPELLPVLKEANVVDSGGQGLMYILEGAYKALTDEELPTAVELNVGSRDRFVDDSHMKPEDITFGYCTEFIVRDAADADENELKEYLDSIGDCTLVIKDDDIIKVHVHTDHPGKAFEKGLSIGPLSRMKVDNMREMLGDIEEAEVVEDEEKSKYGFVSVSPGSGFTKIFEDLGINRVITGGQTMNPSTHDFLEEINSMNADHIFLFPNNGNIILAANQAEAISDKDIHVIPTKTVPDCVIAMLAFDPDSDFDENTEQMDDAIKDVVCGEVTYAVRDTKINGLNIWKNNIIGLSGGDILAKGKKVDIVVEKLLEKLIVDDHSFISLYYGEDVDKEDANILESLLCEKFKNCEFEMVYGGQPLYYYIFSIE